MKYKVGDKVLFQVEWYNPNAPMHVGTIKAIRYRYEDYSIELDGRIYIRDESLLEAFLENNNILKNMC